MTENPIGFGILGCGVIAGFHADAIANLNNARLLGVADALPGAAERFAESRGVRAYPDFGAMLADPEIDAVCICTPSSFHCANALQALQAGRHVVLEKPMAFTEAEALELGRALFTDPHNRVPALRTLLFVLQNRLNLPEAERLSTEELFGTRKRALRDLRTFRRNTLLYPTNGIDEFLKQNG